jgi:hypothetical protein
MAVNHYPRVNIRLPAAGRRRLEATAQEMNVTLSEATRRLLLAGLRQRMSEQTHPGMSDRGDRRIRG